MPLLPFSWNAIVIGAWNTAILTPDGIRQRLFQLPENATVELEMAVDRPGQYRVGHDGLVVIPTMVSLEVSTRRPEPTLLTAASRLCQRALQSLPETPVSAAGINIRYKFSDAVPDYILDITHTELDDVLSDNAFVIRGRTIKRTLNEAPGVINVQIAHSDAEGTIEFNFHKDSNRITELTEWLGRIEGFIASAERIITTLGVNNVIHA